MNIIIFYNPMQEQFTHIATLLFKHNYFEDGLFQSLEAKPSALKMQRLQNLGLVLQQFSGGVRIFRSVQNQMTVPEGEEPVRIALHCSDSHYLNYTEFNGLNYSEENLIYTNIYASNTVSLPDYHLEAYISQNNEATGNANNKKILAVEIHLDILLTHFEENANAVTYVLDFEARKTYWKYFFIPSTNSKIKNLEITFNGHKDYFEFTTDGDTFIFTSKLPIALAQTNKNEIELNFIIISQIHGTINDYIQLPAASAERLDKADNPALKEFFSQMYVQV